MKKLLNWKNFTKFSIICHRRITITSQGQICKVQAKWLDHDEFAKPEFEDSFLKEEKVIVH